MLIDAASLALTGDRLHEQSEYLRCCKWGFYGFEHGYCRISKNFWSCVVIGGLFESFSGGKSTAVLLAFIGNTRKKQFKYLCCFRWGFRGFEHWILSYIVQLSFGAVGGRFEQSNQCGLTAAWLTLIGGELQKCYKYLCCSRWVYRGFERRYFPARSIFRSFDAVGLDESPFLRRIKKCSIACFHQYT